MRKKLIGLGFLFFIVFYTSGQEIGVYNYTFNNLYLINPAAAGAQGYGVGYLTYHKYWNGIEGAPEIGSLSFNSPTKAGRVSLGFNIFSDKRSILNSSGAFFTFGYNIPFSESDMSSLRFGISGGAAFNSFDINKITVTDSLDPAIYSKLKNSVSPNGNFGIQLILKHFDVGFSMPKLFSTPVISGDRIAKAEFQQFDNMIFNAGYKFQVVPKVVEFYPTFIYRMYKGNPAQWETNAVFTFNQSLWIGANYRNGYGFAALAGFKVKKLSIGYAYEVPTNEIRNYASASHEIQLAFHFGKKKLPPKKPLPSAVKKPVKAPIDTKKPPVLNKPVTVKAIGQPVYRAPAKPAKPKVDSIEKKPEVFIVKKPEPVVITKASPIVIKKTEQNKEPVKSQITTPPIKITKDTVAKTITYQMANKTIVVSSSEKIVVARRGSHPLELETGNYVIVGAFSIHENAEKFKNKVMDQGYPASLGYNSDKNLFYVHIFSSEDVDKAIVWKNELRKKEGFQDAWLFVVE